MKANAGYSPFFIDWFKAFFGNWGVYLVKLGINLGIILLVLALIVCCVPPCLKSLFMKATVGQITVILHSPDADNEKPLAEINTAIEGS